MAGHVRKRVEWGVVRSDPAREIAREAGRKRYMPVRPCYVGHVAERYVSNAMCCACDDERRAQMFNPRKRANG
jgi:hypothetical protein